MRGTDGPDHGLLEGYERGRCAGHQRQRSCLSKDAASKDPAKFASYYADDATLMMPNEPILHGASNAKAAVGPMMQDQNFAFSFQGDKVEVSGDLAYTQGTYSMTMTDQKGIPATDKGKYLTVWKKQADGSWKVIEDMFNSDLPAGGN